MQPIAVPPRGGRIAFQQGLIFGIIQTVIAATILLINTFVITSVSNAFGALLLSILSFLAGLAMYFVAGIMASKQTGRVSTGTLAGMWAGIIYGVINLVISLVIFFAISYPKLLAVLSTSPSMAQNPDAARAGVIIGGVVATVLGAIFAIGLGSGLGALGGLVGRNISPIRPMVVEAPAYPVYNQPYPSITPPPNPYTYQPPAAPGQPGNDQPGSAPYQEQPH